MSVLTIDELTVMGFSNQEAIDKWRSQYRTTEQGKEQTLVENRHTDTPHTDTYQQVAYGQTHSNRAHTNAYGKASHVNTHTNVAHTDSYTPHTNKYSALVAYDDYANVYYNNKWNEDYNGNYDYTKTSCSRRKSFLP